MTDRYAVIGHPIAHSKSPMIHAWFAEQTGQDMRYEKILAPRDGFAPAVQDFIRGGGRGMNVTLPFKEEASRFATRLSERARAAGAAEALADPRGIDFVMVRENMEGLYPAREGDLAELARAMPELRDRIGRRVGEYGEGRFAVKVVSRAGTERIARFACALARRRRARGPRRERVHAGGPSD